MASSEKKPAVAKPVKLKKPMPGAVLVIICVVAFMFILGGLFAALLTNAAGLSDQLIALLPQYKTMAAGLEKEKADLASVQAQVQAGKEENIRDAETNAKTAESLKAREVELTATQQALATQEKEGATQEERKKAVIAIFQNLSAAKAAGILAAGYTTKQAADMLSLLPTDTAAGILAAMDTAKAAEITKLMMQ
jgi:flagellar motility protein MotE (MotC chaperone)